VSEHWAQSNSTDESSANGVSPDYAIGLAEPLGDEATATDGEQPDDEATVEGHTDEAPVAEAADGTPAETSDDEGAPPVVDDGSTFLADLVRAMQATAELERVRINEDIDRRRQDQVDRVQARKASEADRMRELADEDMAAIDAWVDRETARIQLERERRAAAVRVDLETSLAEHGSKIDREIEGIDTAIATYRAEVEAYFEGLDRETDPVLIAQKAASRPAFPALEAVGETITEASIDEAAADVAGEEPAAAGEPVVVGVMDPAAPTEPVESWAGSPEPSTTADPDESSDDGPQGGTVPEFEEAVHAGVTPSIGGPGALLKSVPAKRPMSWLRRNED
jgi:hypothetical protein